MTPDVLIVGAGPAGAVAAIVLARAGARVLVLDRARFPRPKLCGDTINPGALRVLHRLGLAGVVEGGRPIRGMIVTGGGARVVGPYRVAEGAALTRSILDARLVGAARAAGAAVEEGALVHGPLMDETGRRVAGVRVRTAGGEHRITAPVTIAADGHFSRLARAVRLSRSTAWPRRWAIGGYFESVSGLGAFGEMHVRPDHYIGVAPMPDGSANACLVTAGTARLREPDPLRAALLADPALRERFAAARPLGAPVRLGPLAVDATRAGMPGLLLAGDAAGFVDPMTGDGLRFAFRGGELAAAAAAGVLRDGWRDAEARLARARQAEFGAKCRFNRTLRALVGSPLAVRAAGAGASIVPAAVRRVIQYAGDVR